MQNMKNLSQAASVSPSVRPIIPAPRAMLADDSRSKFGVPQAPPPPPNFIRPTIATSSPTCSTTTVSGAVANHQPGGPAMPLPPPPPPPPLPAQLVGMRQKAPPAPPSLASLRPVSDTATVPEKVVEAPPAVNEQFYTFPLQKSRKTKTLYWNKLAPHTLNESWL